MGTEIKVMVIEIIYLEIGIFVEKVVDNFINFFKLNTNFAEFDSNILQK